jgi:hypothetical protein
MGVTTRVSVKSNGAQANAESQDPSISANGRFVTFESAASNFFPGDTLGWDIFVHDRWLGTTTLISQSTSGVHANQQALNPSISADGTVVVFQSLANNLLDGGDPNGFTEEVFVRECPPTVTAHNFCTAKMSSLACIPTMDSTGTPSTSSTSPFDLRAIAVLNNRPGMLLYSTSGQTLLPFQGGYLCLVAPLERTSVQNSGGTPPPTWDCSGVFHYDFNALIQSGFDSALVAGQTVWTQYWYRDAGLPPPYQIGLSDALEFTIQ